MTHPSMQSHPDNNGASDISISISGMSCQHCVSAVQRALTAVQGVEVRDVKVGSATVAVNTNVVSVDVVLDAIRDEGYDAQIAS